VKRSSGKFTASRWMEVAVPILLGGLVFILLATIIFVVLFAAGLLKV